MAFKQIFFYNTDAAEAGSAAAATDTQTQDNNAGQQQADTSVVSKDAIELPQDVIAKLAEYEELKRYKEENTKPARTADELKQDAELEKVNLKKYAVENKLAVDDDFVKFDTLQQKKDADLVFEDFLADFKEENAEIEDEKELLDAAKEEFEKAYKLSSKNEKVKEKGIAKLAKEANEIRSPFKSKVEKAQTAYSEDKELRAKMPAFDKFITTQIEKNATDKVSYKVKSGEEEIPVEIDLTKEDKEAIAKEFNTPKSFLQFSKSPEEAQKALDKKIQGWIKVNKFDEVLAKTAEKFTGIGVAKGSNVGAENLFALAGGKGKVAEVADNKANQEANIARERARIGR